MIGDQLFEERREEIRDAAREYSRKAKRALPEHCEHENCTNPRSVGLVETRMGAWYCFTCFRARIDELEAEKNRVLGMLEEDHAEQTKSHTATEEVLKSMNVMMDLILRRIDHVEAP